MNLQAAIDKNRTYHAAVRLADQTYNETVHASHDKLIADQDDPLAWERHLAGLAAAASKLKRAHSKALREFNLGR